MSFQVSRLLITGVLKDIGNSSKNQQNRFHLRPPLISMGQHIQILLNIDICVFMSSV